MMSLLGPFALSTRPFSATRFVAFMAGLVAISTVSILGEQRARGSEPATAAPGAGTAASATEATVVRFPYPLRDVREDLRLIGLPWFLRRQGAAATVDGLGESTITVAVSLAGKPVGTYEERLQALDEDRSKLFVSFTAADMSLVDRLAAPIKTKLDPVNLFRVVMAEHIRASLQGGSFDLKVLDETPGSRAAVFRKAFMDSGSCENPQTDDFLECANVAKDASIRRAYRDEAARRGR